ncbi:MAG: TetR family transcriptional regulator [Alphaproteobacteria bacterium]|nr:TetR family transcriptional regulator [Alphaproteobacteria bacterium]
MNQDNQAPTRDVRRHQTKKSIATRNSILDATIQCFLELGYHRTTTTEIAKRANVTRGAVQYYFPTTPDVLRASIDHMIDRWIETYAEELRKMPASANKLTSGVDIYWRFVQHPLFVAWQELQAAARTDPELAEIVDAGARRYDERRLELGREVYGDVTTVDNPAFAVARDLLRVALEGLSVASFGHDREKRQEAVLDLLKQMMDRMLGSTSA